MKDKNGLDIKKLHEAGVSDGLIAELDPREGGNITQSGDVLYLDEERREAKVDRRLPLRKNRPDGIGLKNLMVRTSSRMITAEKSASMREKIFPMLIKLSEEPEESLKGMMLHSFLGTNDKGYTHVHVLPLNVDLTEKHQTVIIPYDLMVSEVKDADYIAIMNYCICRKSMDCKHYPHDLGCIFTGIVARTAVKAGIAHEATLDEAVAHIDRAAELGLMGAADFVEGEQFVWGLKNSEMNQYRMICFCCDCCCVALNVLKHSKKDVRRRYTPVGWTAVVDHTKCVGCQACAKKCPQKCITFGEDRLRITDQDACMGCGICKTVCKFGAVSIKQTMPMRESLNAYFLNEGRVDDGLPHAPAVHIES